MMALHVELGRPTSINQGNVSLGSGSGGRVYPVCFVGGVRPVRGCSRFIF